MLSIAQVMQRGRTHEVRIKKTHDKGWGESNRKAVRVMSSMNACTGVFAGEDIANRVFVGVLAGEYISEAECNERERWVYVVNATTRLT